MGRGKGSLLIHTRNYVVKNHGAGAWNDVIAAMSDADREVLNGVLLAGSWYPIGVINRVLVAFLERRYSRSPEDEMRRLSAYIADSDLGSVYKMALRMGSPEFLLRRTDSLWNRYFDVGKLRAFEVGANHWSMTLDMAVGTDVAPNHFFCGPGCPAWIEMGLKLTGADRASVRHVQCRYRNGSSCTYVATW